MMRENVYLETFSLVQNIQRFRRSTNHKAVPPLKSVKVCVWYGCWRVRVGVKEGFVVFSDDWYLLKNWGKLVLLYIHMICGLQSQALQYYTYVTLYTSLLC